jgi:hypothetical protein
MMRRMMILTLMIIGMKRKKVMMIRKRMMIMAIRRMIMICNLLV